MKTAFFEYRCTLCKEIWVLATDGSLRFDYEEQLKMDRREHWESVHGYEAFVYQVTKESGHGF